MFSNKPTLRNRQSTGGGDDFFWVPHSFKDKPTGDEDLSPEEPSGNKPRNQRSWPSMSIFLAALGIIAGSALAVIALYVSMFQQPLSDVKAKVNTLDDTTKKMADGIQEINNHIESVDVHLQQIDGLLDLKSIVPKP